MLYLFHISQTKVDWYDTYDSAVVVAVNEDEAKRTHPHPGRRGRLWHGDRGSWQQRSGDAGEWEDVSDDTWSTPEHVTAVKLGPLGNTAFKAGDVVCASFNAG